MITTTTPNIEGMSISAYHGVCTGEAVVGANIVKDLFARVTNILGGRSGSYENEFRRARLTAINELQEHARERGANAVVAIDLDYEVIRDSMMVVSATGTAVTVK